MGMNVDWEELFAAARSARDHAYAPYSKFRVGAALKTTDGRLFSGCNVENASYGLSLCAERNALAAAVKEGSPRFVAVAILADSSRPCPPCGACRQVLAELAEKGAEVRYRGAQGQEERTTVAELLPRAFGPDFL